MEDDNVQIVQRQDGLLAHAGEEEEVPQKSIEMRHEFVLHCTAIHKWLGNFGILLYGATCRNIQACDPVRLCIDET
jgi:hypothetical protein